MEWGLFVVSAQPPQLTQRAALLNSLAYAQAAEQLGFSDVWVLEHHFTRFALIGAPLLHAAYILGQTKRIKVGTAINIVPIHHPVELAEQVALLDQLSGGRLLYGVGRGGFTKDFEVFGRDMGKSREMMIEWVDIIVRAWTTGKASADSDLIKFREIEVYPEPFTKPHPPIYTVPESPTSIEWAAKHGYPMILPFGMEDERRAAQIELYSEIAEKAGFDPDSIPHALSLLASTGKDGDAVRDAWRSNMCWWQDEYMRATDLFKPEGSKIAGYEYWHRRWEESVIKGDSETDKRVANYLRVSPVGTPQECIDKLQKTIDITGVKKFICGFEGMVVRDAVLDSIQMFTEEVIPKIKPPTKRYGS